MPRERSHPSPTARDVLLQDLVTEVRAFQNAVDQLDQAVADRLGINRTDLRCLDVCEREGRIAAGALAEATGLTTGAVTNLLDRMERAGFVRRVPDPNDRRRVLAELTDLARTVCGELYGPLADDDLARLDDYSAEDLAVVRDFLRRGRRLNERHAARVRGGESVQRHDPDTSPDTTALDG